MRQSGRTTRMILKALLWSMEPGPGMTIVVAANYHHASMLMRKMTDLIYAMLGMDSSIFKIHRSDKYIVFGEKKIHFVSGYDKVDNLLIGNNHAPFRIFEDHYFTESHGQDRQWKYRALTKTQTQVKKPLTFFQKCVNIFKMNE